MDAYQVDSNGAGSARTISISYLENTHYNALQLKTDNDFPLLSSAISSAPVNDGWTHVKRGDKNYSRILTGKNYHSSRSF